MGTFLQDLRYALRMLIRQPAFTAVAVFTLAIGIGANTAIYSVVDATLLRALPYQEPDRLMHVSLMMPAYHGRPPLDDMVWSYPKSETFRQLQPVFEDVALYGASNFNVTGSDQPERIDGEAVSASYFPLLRVRAAAGRTFLPSEDAVPERDFVAVISYNLWQRRFNLDPQIAGKTINLDSKPYTIVGVLPADFQGLSGPSDIWVPIHTEDAQNLAEAQSHSWYMIARLKPGETVEHAKSIVKQLGPRVDAAFPREDAAGWGAKARTLAEAQIDPIIRRSVLVLFGAVSFVLLIACVNIANLLLARGSVRQREIAIRLAIGANRARLVRQLLTESILLALAGAAAGLAVAYAGVRALAGINPASASAVDGRIFALTTLGLRSIHLDSRALLFTFAVALLTGILFGLAPALQGSRTDVTGALKNSSARPSRFAGFHLLTGKSLLVVVEVALAVVLLAGAGLMMKSFSRLLATRIGVDPENVLTIRMNLEQDPPARAAAFFSQAEQRVATLPGVVSAALSNCYALSGACGGTLARVFSHPVTPGTEPIVGVVWASTDYFKTMRISLLRGRNFAASDRQGSPKVVLINETAARRLWPGEDPIGKVVAVGQGGFHDGATVIGVVSDVRYRRIDELPRPDVYLSYQQSPRPSAVLFVRTAGNPAALTTAIQNEIHALNRDLPLYDVKTMDERIRDATAKARFSAVLLALFAAIAIALAAVGIYGVMSYLVTQRTREIGIRIALGATSAEVLGLVVRRGAALAFAGIVIGVAAALFVTRVLVTLLYEVKPGDPATYVQIAAVLAAVAIIAAYLPARRASAVDPASALRAE
jgi:putative ABC transport system permease protein